MLFPSTVETIPSLDLIARQPLYFELKTFLFVTCIVRAFSSDPERFHSYVAIGMSFNLP